MVGWMDGWLVFWFGWLVGWMDGWLVGWMDGWMDGLIDVIICNIYRPPRYLNEDYRQFTDGFATLLTLFDSCNNEILAAGDFKINLLKTNDKEIFSDFYDTVTECSFFLKITLPPHSQCQVVL